MQLARLGVDEVGGERARVAAEERVRERAVAPEEAAEVEADEQLRARVEQPPAQVGHAAAGEEGPERQRVVEVPRDQDRVEVAAALGDDADGLDDRHLVGGERAEQPVLAPGELDRQLLERVQLRPERAVVLDEANDVAVDPAHDLDEALVLPLGERLVPGQVEEVRVAGARDQLQPGGQLSRRGARGRASGTSRATRAAARAAGPTWPPRRRTGRGGAGGPATARAEPPSGVCVRRDPLQPLLALLRLGEPEHARSAAATRRRRSRRPRGGGGRRRRG